jgi:hypothetical protein
LTEPGCIEAGVRRTCTPQDGTAATVLALAARNGTFTTTSPGFNVLYGATSVQVQYQGPVNRTGCGVAADRQSPQTSNQTALISGP